MFLTKEYIESELESLNNFHIRKIKWAINELERDGVDVTKWNIIEKSGVKLRYWDAILNEIQDYLNEKGYY